MALILFTYLFAEIFIDGETLFILTMEVYRFDRSVSKICLPFLVTNEKDKLKSMKYLILLLKMLYELIIL